MAIHFLNVRITRSDPDLSETEVSEQLKGLSKVVDETIGTVRRIASELRPSILDDVGLVPAIEWQAQEFERKTKIRCLFQAETDDLDLGAEPNTAVFRIFQETLTNIARHADAKKVCVNLTTSNGTVTMRVDDDGKGIDLRKIRQTHSLGILGMQERSRLIGAKLDISGVPGGGTSIELRIPKSAKISGLTAKPNQ
jgi:signal transduction histidine kinase